MTKLIDRLFSLDGRVAIVTGASSGIGRMAAAGLVGAGARVYIVARGADDLAAVAAELSHEGECVAVPGDVATLDGVRSVADSVLRRESKVHILVNNAGVTHGAPLEDFPDEELDRAWNVNVKAVFHLTRALLPQLRASASVEDPARVINVSSVNGSVVPELAGHKGSGPVRESWGYAASKAGVNMLTRHLAHRLAIDNITVNAIAPGPFESRLTAGFADPDIRSSVEAMVPLGRVGTPDDISGTTVFLASRAAAYLTGAIIPVDGGWSTHG